MRRIPFILILCLLLHGCSLSSGIAESSGNKLHDHLLYIDENGTLLDPSVRPNSGSMPENQALKRKIEGDDEDEYVQSILDKYEAKKKLKKNLVLKVYIHGGLNTFNAARDAAVWQLQAALQDEQEDIYPLFISWDSSLSSNYKDHLFHLRRGKKKGTAIASSPYILAEDLLRSAARLPVSANQVMGGRERLQEFSYDVPEEVKRAETCKAEQKEISKLIKAGIKIHSNKKCLEPERTKTDRIMQWNPIKLISAPLVDSFGTGAWGAMLRRADFILRKDEIDSKTAVSKFFDEFQARFHKKDTNAQQKGGRDYDGLPPVDIMGHSMGTIVANNIIIKYPGINFQNIVFMASASRLKDLKYIISPYLEMNRESEFYNLSLNAYRDLNESNYYDLVPRGSLLIWIDQIFGATNSSYDRVAGFWYNILPIADSIFSKEVRSRVHLTQFDINHLCLRNHGSFNVKDRKYWRKSFWLGEEKGEIPSGDQCSFKPHDVILKLLNL